MRILVLLLLSIFRAGQQQEAVEGDRPDDDGRPSDRLRSRGLLQSDWRQPLFEDPGLDSNKSSREQAYSTTPSNLSIPSRRTSGDIAPSPYFHFYEENVPDHSNSRSPSLVPSSVSNKEQSSENEAPSSSTTTLSSSSTTTATASIRQDSEQDKAIEFTSDARPPQGGNDGKGGGERGGAGGTGEGTRGGGGKRGRGGDGGKMGRKGDDAGITSVADDIQPRIFNGETADEGEFPFFAHVTSFRGVCGGTLIWPDIVLTAASCQELFSRNTRVYIGATTRENDFRSDQFFVEELFLHPDYQVARHGNVNFNDIMLVKLNGRSSRTAVQLQSDSTAPSNNQEATMVGFGNTNDFLASPSFSLQKTTVTVIDFETCNRDLQGVLPGDATYVCSSDGDTGFCTGDTGGPLLSTVDPFLQFGIASFSAGCPANGEPYIYTRVSAYLRWIQSTICDQELTDPLPDFCFQVVTPAPTNTPTSSPVSSPPTRAPSLPLPLVTPAPIPVSPTPPGPVPPVPSSPTPPRIPTASPSAPSPPVSRPTRRPTLPRTLPPVSRGKGKGSMMMMMMKSTGGGKGKGSYYPGKGKGSYYYPGKGKGSYYYPGKGKGSYFYPGKGKGSSKSGKGKGSKKSDGKGGWNSPNDHSENDSRGGTSMGIWRNNRNIFSMR